ncbi:hypothetical protein AWB71_05337 [Caballeronia peredens]|nr:hypothetical protein AWB71_05337 [Caballeronia peredens]
MTAVIQDFYAQADLCNELPSALKTIREYNLRISDKTGLVFGSNRDSFVLRECAGMSDNMLLDGMPSNNRLPKFITKAFLEANISMNEVIDLDFDPATELFIVTLQNGTRKKMKMTMDVKEYENVLDRAVARSLENQMEEVAQ